MGKLTIVAMHIQVLQVAEKHGFDMSSKCTLFSNAISNKHHLKKLEMPPFAVLQFLSYIQMHTTTLGWNIKIIVMVEKLAICELLVVHYN